MLSLELAKKLKSAGLKWEPKLGDLYYYFDDLFDAMDAEWMSYFNQGLLSKSTTEESVWIPSLSQLLAEIEGRGYDYRLEYKEVSGLCDYSCVISKKGQDKYFGWGADELEDAAAHALLWILERGNKNE